MTDIQRKAILPALQGKDILGAARTGSGKTLAFLIPLLEMLQRKKFGQYDGLGALVISPTRELAIQIFEVLRKIGRAHSFSAGLVIGGKDVKTEAERLGKLNILIGTPGRLLQHMDQTSDFDLTNLQLLVLDEADRILDMGFKKTIDAIVDNLPSERQTWLFSATQTKSVSDLARLSLSSPEYISTQEESTTMTPKNLEQFYISCELPDKLSTLYGFIKTHLKAKVLVFFSSSKQVRYVYETFRTLQPGIPLLHLHGKQKQTARIEAVNKFSTAKHSCLFATDIVARGIDFPTVDWVVQVDCPEDTATYIHRVGRSARFDKKGDALLFLTPKEEPAMVANLESRKIPIKKLTIRESKTKQIQDKLQGLCFKNPELKYLGQKAFMSYVRSVHLQKDKDVFKVSDLPLEKFALSLGLPGAPKLKINDAGRNKELKNAPRQLLALKKANEDGEFDASQTAPVRTKYDRMFERKNQNVLSDHYLKLTKAGAEEDEDEDFMTVKRADHNIDGASGSEDEGEDNDLNGLPESKRAAKKALSKKASLKNRGNPTKLVFDDEGKPHALYELENEDDFKAAGDAEEQKEEFLGKEREAMKERDVEDKATAKEKRQEKKRRRQELERMANEGESDDGEAGGDRYEVTLGGDEAPLEIDFEGYGSSSDDDASPPPAKKARRAESPQLLEVEEPETLEDLEALSSRLLRK